MEADSDADDDDDNGYDDDNGDDDDGNTGDDDSDDDDLNISFYWCALWLSTNTTSATTFNFIACLW